MGVQWNLTLLNLPQVWSLGITGAGVVIGGQDTGYEWEHPALKRQYRGWDAASGTWITTAIGMIRSPPAAIFTAPILHQSHAMIGVSSHGTHTMGTMVGNDLDPEDGAWPAGAPHAIGVAPGAEWIGCRNMRAGSALRRFTLNATNGLSLRTHLTEIRQTDGDPALAPPCDQQFLGLPAV
jgi:serine protease AprX